MYSFQYTPLYNFRGIQLLPNKSLKRELEWPFKFLINCSFMKISENLQFKTVQFKTVQEKKKLSYEKFNTLHAMIFFSSV